MGYNTDLTDKQWHMIQPMIPPNTGTGRPTEIDLRQVVNAILYLVRTGCQWRNLPTDFPQWGNVYYYFRKWSTDGDWKRINENLRYQEREKRGRNPEPTGAIIDSQSVKTTEAGGERGYNGSKYINGRKRHVVVDTVGNLLSVVVNAANSQDREGAKEAFSRLKEETLDSLQMIWADNGYRGPKFLTWIQEKLQAELEIATVPPNEKGFVVVPVRWVVERTLGCVDISA